MERKTSRNARKYHGLGGTPTYRSWYSMIDRCLNPANPSWPHYGGKGVSVCERWLEIDNFVADMGIRPDGTSIDRLDNAKGYEPGNCRWASELDQQRHRGNVKCSVELASKVRQAKASGQTNKEIAAWAGLDPSGISRIVCGKTWRADAQPE